MALIGRSEHLGGQPVLEETWRMQAAPSYRRVALAKIDTVWRRSLPSPGEQWNDERARSQSLALLRKLLRVDL